MRELKFRVWDSEKRIMFSHDWLYSACVQYGALVNNPRKAIITMQFTGLKDKAGKEIYEGDLVKLTEPNRNYTVEFIEFGFKLVHADPKLQRMIWGNVQRVVDFNWGIEVIGNIYENTELL